MGIDFDAVKRLVPLSRVLTWLGWSALSINGSQRRGRCPLRKHDRSKREFAVRGEGWYCHKCGRGGDVLDLWASVRGVPLYPAAQDLCAHFNLTVPRGNAGVERY